LDKDEAALVEAWTAGDHRAGTELIRPHLKVLRRFVRRRLRDGADDVVQETLAACATSVQRFRAQSRFGTFLLGIARNQVFAYGRRLEREGALALEALAVFGGLDPSPSCDETTESSSSREVTITRAVAELPVQLRRVIELSFWASLGQDDIAKKLGVPVGTVASRLRRAKQLLRDHVLSRADAPEFEPR
jgi:RNA polymerase sigma factor (sigma-70 family)